MDDLTQFPRWQYSLFVSDGEQIVVRSNDFNEFILSIEKVKNELLDHPLSKSKTTITMDPEDVPHPVTQPMPLTSSTSKACIFETCTGIMRFKSGVSKVGKAYAGYFCDVNKDHVDWVSTKK